ncbi:MAG: hypothetical protein VXY94_06900, partial [Planctomycetota bacterium]|nr:hypothetical protein [Planctomycetota bacterium]
AFGVNLWPEALGLRPPSSWSTSSPGARLLSSKARRYLNPEVLEYRSPQLDPRDPTAVPLVRDDVLLIERGWIALQGESHPIDVRDVSIRDLE